jgi:lipopolysaccharide export system permease protein
VKTLHAYLLRQVLLTLSLTVAVFTFVLMLGSVLREILGLLVNRQADGGLVLQAIGLLIPFVMVFALPMGMLTAALLVFGRLSADNELTAMRASGVSLLSMISPVLLLSVVLSLVAAGINMQVAPVCRVIYKQLLYQVGMAHGASFLQEKTYIKDFPGCIVYVSKVRGTNLEDVLIYRLEDEKVASYSRADEGTIDFNASNHVISVVLFKATTVFFRDGHQLPQPIVGEQAEFYYTNQVVRPDRKKVDLSDMTFLQLRQELRSLERQIDQPFGSDKLSNEDLRQRMRQVATQRKDITMPVRVQMNRQVSFSFACFGFTLVAVPLGIRAHRRETTFGIAVALMLVVVYYSFFIMGQALETRPELAPHLLLWAPNFLFQVVGAMLLWRANRGI